MLPAKRGGVLLVSKIAGVIPGLLASDLKDEAERKLLPGVDQTDRNAHESKYLSCTPGISSNMQVTDRYAVWQSNGAGEMRISDRESGTRKNAPFTVLRRF